MIKCAVLALTALLLAGAQPAAMLRIYFIDVEGGQSTLVVTPRQSLLVDAGYGGNKGRDRDRILAAAKDAAVTQIDFLVVTHFHSDHVGGVPDLALHIPIRTFVDYDAPSGADATAATPFHQYTPVRARAAHLVAKAGTTLPLAGAEVDIVSAGGETIARPLRGAGQRNNACAAYERHADDPSENSRSVGIRVSFGRFRFLDLGDLNWNPLGRLVCPVNLIGRVDLFLVPHHTNDDSTLPAMLAALAPRVIVSDNGATKGGSPGALALIQRLPNTDAWQLHKSTNSGATNSDDSRLANVDEGRTGYWIKVTATEDGAFTVENQRTKTQRRYD
jgi:competence protein ComEC